MHRLNTPPTTHVPRTRLPWLALALIAPAPSIGIIAALHLGQGPLGVTLWAAAKVWLLLLPALWYLLIERGRISFSPPRHGGLAVGAALGLLISLIIVAAWWFVGRSAIDPQLIRDKVQAAGLTNPTIYLAGALYWITVNSLLEEYAYRWFISRQAERVTGSIAAVFLSAAIFTVHHVIALTSYMPLWIAILASLGVFIGGAAWSWLYIRYRSIWPAYVSHAIVDIAVFALGYVILFT